MVCGRGHLHIITIGGGGGEKEEEEGERERENQFICSLMNRLTDLLLTVRVQTVIKRSNTQYVVNLRCPLEWYFPNIFIIFLKINENNSMEDTVCTFVYSTATPIVYYVLSNIP